MKYKELSKTEREIIRIYREIEAKKKEIAKAMKIAGEPRIFVPSRKNDRSCSEEK